MIGGSATAAALTNKVLEAQPTAKAIQEPHAPVIDLGQFWDIRSWVLYSRFDSEDFAERNIVPLFTRSIMEYPRGYSSTNMVMGGQLPAPQTFAITGVSVILDRIHTQTQAHMFERNIAGGLYIGCKRFADVPTPRVTVLAELDGLVRRDSKGEPTDHISSKILKLDPPLLIPSMMSFRYDLWRRDKRYAMEVGGYVLFDGMLASPVQ